MKISTEREYRPFADEYRDYGRTVIETIVNSVPSLSGLRWWQDLARYEEENAGYSIIDTAGRAPTTAFDHNGVAKWFLNMYNEQGDRINRYLYRQNSSNAYIQCDPEQYYYALCAYMELRNTFLGHAGEEELSPELLLSAADLNIWLVENLYRRDTDEYPSRNEISDKMYAMRQELAREMGVAEGRLSKDAIVDWALAHLHKRKEANEGRTRFVRRSPQAFPFEEWPVAEPVLDAPWEEFIPPETVFPSQLGQYQILRTYPVLMPTTQVSQASVETELEEEDYLAHREKVLTGQIPPTGHSPTPAYGDGMYTAIDVGSNLYAKILALPARLIGIKIGDGVSGAAGTSGREIIDGLLADIKNKVDQEIMIPLMLLWLARTIVWAFLGGLFIGKLISGIMQAIITVGMFLLAYRLFKRIRQVDGLLQEHKRPPEGFAYSLHRYLADATGLGKGLFWVVFLLAVECGVSLPPIFYLMLAFGVLVLIRLKI